MSRKQDENRLKALRHTEAIKARNEADPAAKRLRQRYTSEGLKLKERNLGNDLKEKLNSMKPEELYRADTSKGRRSIARAEKFRGAVSLIELGIPVE